MRPFIHVNCAMSADGKIAGEERKQIRISSDEDIARVKAMRKEYDAILVGVGTVIADDATAASAHESTANTVIAFFIVPATCLRIISQ